MNGLTQFGEALDISGITSTVSVATFQGIIESVLPLVGIAIATSMLFYVIRWAVRMFRGV